MAKHRRETECKFELYGADMFVVYNGQRIAKRGEPGTPQAGTWVVLAPGYAVTGFTQDLVVEFDPSACQ